jgi:hypothetical protein
MRRGILHPTGKNEVTAVIDSIEAKMMSTDNLPHFSIKTIYCCPANFTASNIHPPCEGLKAGILGKR